MTVKFGIKAGVMLSSLALALAFVVGCNSDEATPPATGAGAGAAKPADTAKPPAASPIPKPADEKK